MLLVLKTKKNVGTVVTPKVIKSIIINFFIVFGRCSTIFFAFEYSNFCAICFAHVSGVPFVPNFMNTFLSGFVIT